MQDKELLKKPGCRLKEWELLSSRELLSITPWVKVHMDRIKLPSGRIVDDYYRIQLPEYVMIYARRDDGKILFEQQYLHAAGKIAITLPTGCIEDGESPIDTAKRELAEETGYSANSWKYIGSFMVDGNKGCGKAHFYIAEELEKVSEPVQDDMEEFEILFLSQDNIMKAILSGEIPLLATAALSAIASNPEYSSIK